ncbi:MAG: hypothetical protein AAF289_20480 [Cyanobacteria bacterium P01_A01_bin.135]
MTRPGVHLPPTPDRRKPSSPAPRTAPAAEHSVINPPAPQAPPPPTVTHSRRGVSRPRYWLAGSSLLAGLLLMVDVNPSAPDASQTLTCQSEVQAEAALSRETLAELIAIPERQPKAAVNQVVGQPYCSLSPMEVRAGVQAERVVYPLNFETDAWVVLLYEGEEYAGYDFKFPNR